MSKMRIKIKTGLTLTELLVASILMIVISLGVISINLGINRLTSNNNLLTQASMELDSAMLAITKDASQAVGDSTNPGIWTNKVALPSRNKDICFRLESSPVTAGDYSDDTYVCYSQVNSIIYRCANMGSPSQCPVGGRQFVLNAIDKDTTYADDFFDISPWPAFITIRLLTAPDTSLTCTPSTNPCLTLTTQISPTAHGK